ncbi:signal recognition particle protein [bacterium CPR1]|nr:signal recognition particle protein [bacterium CPR1]
MFESLSDKIGSVLKRLRNRGKLTEEDVMEALREVRRALLEADVSLPVVKEFVDGIKKKAVGEELWKSLTPGQLVVKHVRDGLVELMGGETARLHMATTPPTVILMMGLHGAGKTTTTGKLGLHLKNQGHRPLLVATDVYRPAAIQQLQVLGKQLDISVFEMGSGANPVEIASEAMKYARQHAHDVVLVDTAGRLHIDEELMAELRATHDAVQPQEKLLVVDAMTGQDAVNIAKTFTEQLGVTGIVLTKLDGDARGGAALSVRQVTGSPIKFIGVGEKLGALEPFHPDRMAGRILGMGDVLSLIEKAEAAMDEDTAEKLEKKLRDASFNLEDFLEQMRQMKKMGPMGDLLKLVPGLGGQLKNLPAGAMEQGEGEMKRIEAIILSMTPRERRNPDVLNASRKRRVARGSGVEVSDINQLLKKFEMIKKIMKTFSKPPKRGKGGFPFKLPF